MLKSVWIILILFVIPNIVLAQSNEWIINDFDVILEVRNDGVLNVTEVIQVDFIADRRGIYRDLPVRYNTSFIPEYAPISDIQVSHNGQLAPVQITNNFANTRVRIGDENIYIDGRQQYLINYKVANVIRQNSDGLYELHWNVTGNEWDTIIKNASVVIESSDSQLAQPISLECFTGPLGSTTDCDRVGYSSASTSALNPGSGMTIKTAWPNNTFEINRSVDWLFWSITTGFVLLFVWVIRRSVKKYREWRREGDDPELLDSVVVQYQAPDGITPAIANHILGDHDTARMLSSIILSLGQKGYLSIHQIQKKLELPLLQMENLMIMK